ncbi:hypothetical protein BH10BAC4_BH10BAC4_25040 [soil metagenome]
MRKSLLPALLFFLMLPAIGQTATSPVLSRADSLYNTKQYTQALDLYKTLFAQSRYSPAMLLRMAYIEEGLSRLGESLYYLNLYYLASDDAGALRKMEELAEKNNLEGYKTDDATHAMALIQKHYSTIAWIIASVCVLLMALVYYQLRKMHVKPTLTSLALIFCLVVLFLHINFSLQSERGIVANSSTYLMSGPSAASSVIAIIGEGHQLEINGKKDVWLRVQWKDREVYVKEFLVREIRL